MREIKIKNKEGVVVIRIPINHHGIASKNLIRAQQQRRAKVKFI